MEWNLLHCKRNGRFFSALNSGNSHGNDFCTVRDNLGILQCHISVPCCARCEIKSGFRLTFKCSKYIPLLLKNILIIISRKKAYHIRLFSEIKSILGKKCKPKKNSSKIRTLDSLVTIHYHATELSRLWYVMPFKLQFYHEMHGFRHQSRYYS